MDYDYLIGAAVTLAIIALIYAGIVNDVFSRLHGWMDGQFIVSCEPERRPPINEYQRIFPSLSDEAALSMEKEMNSIVDYGASFVLENPNGDLSQALNAKFPWMSGYQHAYATSKIRQLLTNKEQS